MRISSGSERQTTRRLTPAKHCVASGCDRRVDRRARTTYEAAWRRFAKATSRTVATSCARVKGFPDRASASIPPDRAARHRSRPGAHHDDRGRRGPAASATELREDVGAQMPGSIRSSRTQSGRCRATNSSARSPSGAIVARYPATAQMPRQRPSRSARNPRRSGARSGIGATRAEAIRQRFRPVREIQAGLFGARRPRLAIDASLNYGWNRAETHSRYSRNLPP